jgi:ribosomal protein L37E
MQTIFCTECGAKNEYSGSKPKFCSSCGTPMGATSKATIKQEKKPAAKRRHPGSFKEQMEARKNSRDLPSEDETDVDFVPEISSLSYEITREGNTIHNFKDIIDAAKKENQ